MAAGVRVLLKAARFLHKSQRLLNGTRGASGGIDLLQSQLRIAVNSSVSYGNLRALFSQSAELFEAQRLAVPVTFSPTPGNMSATPSSGTTARLEPTGMIIGMVLDGPQSEVASFST